MIIRRALVSAVAAGRGAAALFQDPALAPGDDQVPGSGPCALAALYVRTPGGPDGVSRPVDLVRAPGGGNGFEGLMDYGMPAFTVEAVAVPRGECELRRSEESAILVAPGSSKVTQVFADAVADPAGSAATYSINVSRAAGDVARLDWVAIKGTTLVPAWEPEMHTYSAFLALHQDYASFTAQRVDNGQLLDVASQPQAPLQPNQHPGGGRRLTSGGGPQRAGPGGTAAAPARMLQILDERWAPGTRVAAPPHGEVQRTPVYFSVPVDVGHQRIVEAVLTSANGKKVTKYRFIVSRPYCPEDRRFFDPSRRVCTEICDEGSFGNAAAGRCAACIVPHCAFCADGIECTMCKVDFRLTGGRCVGTGDGEYGAGAFGGGGAAGLGVFAWQAMHGGAEWAAGALALAVVGTAFMCIVGACCMEAGPCGLLAERLCEDFDDEDEGDHNLDDDGAGAGPYYGSSAAMLSARY